jgi:chorismate dehydratase
LCKFNLLTLEQKIRVGAVSYLNTKPMIYGLENWDQITLSLDYPAKIADKLLNDEIDIGLVPVAIIPQLNQANYITDYGIGATGKVLTVALFSNVAIQEIQNIYLDYQSKTSVQLIKILCKEYWKISPKFENAIVGFESEIKGNEAAVIIGDRTFDLLDQYKYVYDLSAAWYEHTSLPFVFARWVSNKKINSTFEKVFAEKIESNINRFKSSPNFSTINIVQKNYLENIIQYNLTPNHQKGMQLFLDKLKF